MTAGSLVTKIERNTLLNRLAKTNPDYTRITQRQFGTGTTTPSVLDTGLASGVGSKVDIATTTLTLTSSAQEVKFEGKLTSFEGNGSTISELATFNTDGTPRIGMKAVFTGRAKDNSKEFRYTIKNRIDPEGSGGITKLN